LARPALCLPLFPYTTLFRSWFRGGLISNVIARAGDLRSLLTGLRRLLRGLGLGIGSRHLLPTRGPSNPGRFVQPTFLRNGYLAVYLYPRFATPENDCSVVILCIEEHSHDSCFNPVTDSKPSIT